MPDDRQFPTVQLLVTDAGALGLKVYARSSTGEEAEVAVRSDLPHVALHELTEARAEQDLVGLGSQLFTSLFDGDVERIYRSALASADEITRSGRPCRLRLVLTISPDHVAALPWELLFDPVRERFLAIDGRVSLSRSLILHEPTRPLTAPARLRILGLFPNTSKLRTNQERHVLERLGATHDLEVICLDERVTLEAVYRAAAELEPHLVHFSGHGAYHRKALLALDGNDGKPRVIDASNFADALTHTGQPPGAAVINACEAGMVGEPTLRNVAATLLRHGVLGVVAMQTKIPNVQAVLFAKTFYHRLSTSKAGDLEQAVSSGRNLMRSEAMVLSLNDGPEVHFASPVLYLRGDQFTLWRETLDKAPNQTASPHAEPTEAPNDLRIENVHGSGNFAQIFGHHVQVGNLEIHGASDARKSSDWRRSALRHLERKDYEQALSSLEKIAEADDLGPRDRYLLALATLAGRHPRRLGRSDLLQIEKHLKAAIDQSPADTYRLFLAILQYDYYVLNGFEEPRPTSTTLLTTIDFESLDAREVTFLLSRVPAAASNPSYARAVAAVSNESDESMNFRHGEVP